MLERHSMRLIDDKHTANSAEQSAWDKGSHMYGADLFGARDMPESYTAHVRPPLSAFLQLVLLLLSNLYFA